MHNGRMRSHSDIIRDSDTQAVAELTKASVHTVRSWVQRNSIPSEYWSALIDAGHCTADELIAAAASRRAA
jgi:hypothetical protein